MLECQEPEESLARKELRGEEVILGHQDHKALWAKKVNAAFKVLRAQSDLRENRVILGKLDRLVHKVKWEQLE